MTPAAELPQVRKTAKLIVDLAVVHVSEFVIDAQGKDLISLRCAEPFNKRRDAARRDQCRCRRIFSPARARVSWRGQGKQRVPINREQRVDRCRIKNRVELIRGEEMRAVYTAVERQLDWPAERKAGIVFFERRARQSQTLVVECVRVEDVVAIEIIEAP